MSENNENNKNSKNKKDRSPSPNPFTQFLSSSPSNISPRSDSSANASPRSPRFQTEFQNGMRIPINNSTSISNAMITAGSKNFI